MKFIFGLITAVLMVIPSHRSLESDIPNQITPDQIYADWLANQSYYDMAYETLRAEEGNYAWLKNDFGKETYGGITRKWNPKWVGWKHIDSVKAANKVKKLNHNQYVPSAEPHVKEFYKVWWDDWQMKNIKDTLSSLYTFDFAICGPPSVKIIQRCLNKFGYNFKVNGRMSPEMTMAINEVDPIIYVQKLRMMRRDFYKYVANQYHPVKVNDSTVMMQTQKHFLRGWLIRANRVESALLTKLEKPKRY